MKDKKPEKKEENQSIIDLQKDLLQSHRDLYKIISEERDRLAKQLKIYDVMYKYRFN